VEGVGDGIPRNEAWRLFTQLKSYHDSAILSYVGGTRLRRQFTNNTCMFDVCSICVYAL
jgi:hypothetical protein